MGLTKEAVELIVGLQNNIKSVARNPYDGTVGTREWWINEFKHKNRDKQNDYSFSAEAGIAQGSPLSPLLFVLVFDVFLRHLHTSKMGYQYEQTL